MSESEAVRAEVIETDMQLVGNMEELRQGLLAINAKIEKITGAMPDYEIADDAMASLPYKEAKRHEQSLSKLLSEADAERKAFKSGYTKPLDEVERRYKEAIEPAKALHARYKAQRVAKEQEDKEAKEAELREHYEAYAGLLAPVVPYSRLHDPKWANLSAKMAKSKEELEAKVDRIASDWQALKGLPLEFYDQAEARFFDTLDLGAAVAYDAKLAEDRRRIEEMKAAMAPEPEPEPEPEPAAVCEVPPLERGGGDGSAPIHAYEPAPVCVPETCEVPEPMVMVIDACTVSQARQIGRFCGSLGVTGAFKRGSLRDVCARLAEEARREVGHVRG